MGIDRSSTETGTKENSLLSPASEALSAVFRETARVVTLETRQVLFNQGDVGESLYIVLSGRLEISVVSEDGRRLTLNTVGAGQIVGEIAIFDGGPRTATIEATEQSELMEITRHEIRRKIRKNTEIAFELLELAGRRLRWLEGLLEDRSFKSLEVRLAKRVLYLLWSNDGVATNRVALSQAELADHVGATRVAVASVLQHWRQEGFLKSSRGQIEILERQKLEEKAEQEVF